MILFKEKNKGFTKKYLELISRISKIPMEENIKSEEEKKVCKWPISTENMLKIEPLGKCKSKHKDILLRTHCNGYNQKD